MLARANSDQVSPSSACVKPSGPSLCFLALLLASLISPSLAPRAAASVPQLEFLDTCGQVRLAELYPVELAGDEFVTLWNPSSCRVELSNWSLSDGEGSATLPPGIFLESKSTLTIARNGTQYHRAYLTWPSFELLNTTPLVPQPQLRGTLRLANTGDELSLRSLDGTLEDEVRFGDAAQGSEGWAGGPVPVPPPGRVLRRNGFPSELIDSNSAQNWLSLRIPRLGQQDLLFPTVGNLRSVQPLLAPDSLGPAVLELLEGAQQQVWIAAYEFSSATVASVLLDRLAAGVEVVLFVEGQPVGGLNEEVRRLFGMLAAAGATVLLQAGNTSGKIIDRFAAMHAKYLIVDSRWSGIFSENFSPTGMSQDPTFGNRGWGVIVDDSNLAAQLSQLFLLDADPRRMDIFGVTAGESGGLSLPISAVQGGSYRSPFPPWPASPVDQVRLILGPDQVLGPEGLVGILRGASRSIDAELLRVEPFWKTWWGEAKLNPLLEELREAARRGVVVRLLLDPDDQGNEAAVELLASWTRAEALPLSAKLMDRTHPFERLHLKGLILDARGVAVGSQNWGQTSLTENREVTLLLETEELASRFGAAFAFDWAEGGAPPALQTGEPRLLLGLDSAELRPLELSDDGGFVELSWNLGMDGTIDHLGASWQWAPPHAGEFHIALTARDSWGRESSGVLVVIVLGPSFSHPPDGTVWSKAGVAAVPLLLIGGGMLLVQRRRNARRAPRTP